MASAVIHTTRHTDREKRFRDSGQLSQADITNREVPSREAFVSHFQRLRDDTLPEMERIERMLTRVVIAYGLRYCHLDVVAKSFLDLSRDVRRQLTETRKAVLCDERSSNRLDRAHENTLASLNRFRDVVTSDLTCEEATPIYRRLLDSLIRFEANASQVVEMRP
ncbi:MAG: hypothetical protein H6821_05135 [Planctomycetaceae bacterium]|nr:hypothetical protein [Planctomycetales bacterium]MCB9873545.1 hypothetical protein [Planctomycetaceae bacterium]MCB9937109.1 hypothetical protein [Planctomycetaceae bacterium]HRX78195.1 hypothetical protein [Pirellulaceae bacterium]